MKHSNQKFGHIKHTTCRLQKI